MKKLFRGSALLLLLSTLNPQLSSCHAQGTAFTYQGRLNNGSVPANGSYDVTFTLFATNTGSSAVAGPVTNAAVTVSNGLFTTTVDLGNAFPGAARWLELAVSTNGGEAFTVLNPRQPITPTPYAITARTAGTALDVGAGSVVKSVNTLRDDLTLQAGNNVTITPSGNTLTIAAANGGGSSIWSQVNTNAYYLLGRVGIGTSGPLAPLEVNGILRSTRNNLNVQYLQLDGGDASAIRLTGQSAVAAEKTMLIQNLSGEVTPGANNSIQFALGTTAAPSIKMTINKDGNVILPLGGTGGSLAFGTPNFETGITFGGPNRADIRFDGSTLKLLAGPAGSPPSSTNGVIITTAGNVGIGTTGPSAKLDVAASLDAIHGTSTGGAIGVYGLSGNTGVYGDATGNGEGVHGRSAGNGAAVNGTSTGGGTGVYGTSASGWAGYFTGNVGVTGSLEADSVRGFSTHGLAAVYGRNDSGTGWAGYFQGNVYISGTLSTPSDRNVKRDFAAVDTRQVLEKVARMAIQTWAYTNSAGIRHLGAVAQDFKAAFELGADDKSIATVDADGVALAAIQGLNQKLEEREASLRSENAELKAQLNELKVLVQQLAQQK
jgi:hypothetical protein